MPSRYAKFYNLTSLYPAYEENGYISQNDSEEYYNRIRNHLRNNNNILDGDIIFIGDTYQTRQEYGFATVTNNGTDFKSDEYPVMDTPGVYYKNAINEINEFWEEFGGQEYFNEDWIQMIIQEMHYELPSEKWKKLYPKVKKASIVRKKNEEVLSEYFPNDIADKISRLSVFGKKKNVEIKYLQKLLLNGK